MHTAPAPAAVPKLGHVFVIVGENTSPDELTPARAPYIARTLRPRAARVAHDLAFHGSKSLGQYMGLFTGTFSPCEAEDDSPDQCRRHRDSLFAQLEAAGHTWGEWDQSARGSCDGDDHGA